MAVETGALQWCLNPLLSLSGTAAVGIVEEAADRFVAFLNVCVRLSIEG